MNTRRNSYTFEPINRIVFLMIGVFLVTGIIGMRLFYLQVIRYDYYTQKADQEHYGESILPARRGEIFIQDYASKDLVRVATNITLDTLAADPTMIDDKKTVADKVAPMIFDLDDARRKDQDRIKAEIVHAKTPEDIAKIKASDDQELYQQFYNQVLDKLSQEQRPEILLADDFSTEKLAEIDKVHLTGIVVKGSQLLAYPAQIQDRTNAAMVLSRWIEMSAADLEIVLRGINRNVVLKTKIRPEVSAKIKQLIFDDRKILRKTNEKTRTFGGLKLSEVHYRYYPEGTLAANILGYVSGQGGQYGIESKFNNELQGKKGVLKTQKDSVGREITVGESEIKPAIDGDNIVLTIDRSIQLAAERELAQAVQEFRADNGQVIIMEPQTGKIIAMANYPTFNPNSYSQVYETEAISLTDDEIKNLESIENEPNTFWLYRDRDSRDRIKIFKETKEDGTITYEKYKNLFGPEAYQNKTVSQEYEPGSVFKVITMASGIDDGDVKPLTSFLDPGELFVDKNKNGKYIGPDGNRYDYRITNVASKCTGNSNMAWILQNSCNTGIARVAQKMGKVLFYNYILKFGFNERTDIEFDNESPGKVDHFDKPWTESDLATHAFGQGITTTPIQMIAAYAAIINKGVYMQPHIIDRIEEQNGKVIPTQITPVQRVISEQASEIIKAMLVNNVENGDSYASHIKMTDHYIGAKTGTAQTIAGGKYFDGVGRTLTTVIGFGPKENPKFVILAKLDRPRTTQWADSSAGVLLNRMAAYMFEHLNIPADKK